MSNQHRPRADTWQLPCQHCEETLALLTLAGVVCAVRDHHTDCPTRQRPGRTVVVHPLASGPGPAGL